MKITCTAQDHKSEGFSYSGVSWFFEIERATFSDGTREYFYWVTIAPTADDLIRIDLMNAIVWTSKTIFGLNPEIGFPENKYSFMLDIAQGFAECAIGMIKNNQQTDIIEAAMTETRARKNNWSPRTKPTKKQKADMAKATKEVFDLIGVPRMAALLTLPENTVKAWLNRGVIAAFYAAEIEKIPAVKRHGMTKEKLRPDVDVWRLQDLT